MAFELNNTLKSNTPTDIVIAKIKELINNGVLKPGDRLPAERKLSTDLGFGRTHIREALHKLEFYGIIKTLPQSGSIINGLDITTLDGMIADVLNLQDYDFLSLVETRNLLELYAIKLCAERSTEEDIANLEQIHKKFIEAFDTPERVGFDFAFHRAIAEGSHNAVLKAMLMIIIPDILSVYQKESFCAPDPKIIEQHTAMLIAIKQRNADEAGAVMREHLSDVMIFAKKRIKNQ